MSLRLSHQESEVDILTATPSVSVATIISCTDEINRKIQKLDERDTPTRIDEWNVSIFKVLKKKNLQKTRTQRHID